MTRKKAKRAGHAMIGKQVSYGNDGRSFSGTVIDSRSISTIVDITTGEKRPDVQFLLRPDDGSADFWTVSFPVTP